MKNITSLESMNQMTVEFNKDECINNVAKTLGYEELDELPHYDTINNFLKKLEPIKIEKIRDYMIQELFKKEYKNKDTGEIEKTIYFHYVLEAKLVIENMVFSIDTKFIENEGEVYKKQDCEIKAFKRLAERLKKRYKRLPICILGDSLYALEPIFQIYKKNNWKYIFTIDYQESLVNVVEAN